MSGTVVVNAPSNQAIFSGTTRTDSFNTAIYASPHATNRTLLITQNPPVSWLSFRTFSAREALIQSSPNSQGPRGITEITVGGNDYVLVSYLFQVEAFDSTTFAPLGTVVDSDASALPMFMVTDETDPSLVYETGRFTIGGSVKPGLRIVQKTGATTQTVVSTLLGINDTGGSFAGGINLSISGKKVAVVYNNDDVELIDVSVPGTPSSLVFASFPSVNAVSLKGNLLAMAISRIGQTPSEVRIYDISANTFTLVSTQIAGDSINDVEFGAINNGEISLHVADEASGFKHLVYDLSGNFIREEASFLPEIGVANKVDFTGDYVIAGTSNDGVYLLESDNYKLALSPDTCASSGEDGCRPFVAKATKNGRNFCYGDSISKGLYVYKAPDGKLGELADVSIDTSTAAIGQSTTLTLILMGPNGPVPGGETSVTYSVNNQVPDYSGTPPILTAQVGGAIKHHLALSRFSSDFDPEDEISYALLKDGGTGATLRSAAISLVGNHGNFDGDEVLHLGNGTVAVATGNNADTLQSFHLNFDTGNATAIGSEPTHTTLIFLTDLGKKHVAAYLPDVGTKIFSFQSGSMVLVNADAALHETARRVVDGNFIYFFEPRSPQTIYRIDISDPANPTNQTSINPVVAVDFLNLAASEDYLLGIDGFKLSAYKKDLSDVNPVATVDVVSSIVKDLKYADNHVFTIDESGLFKITELAESGSTLSLNIVAELLVPANGLNTLKIHDGTAFIGTEDGKVLLYDITKPALPVLINTYEVGATVNDLILIEGNDPTRKDDDRMVVVGKGIGLVTLKPPTNEQNLGFEADHVLEISKIPLEVRTQPDAPEEITMTITDGRDASGLKTSDQNRMVTTEVVLAELNVPDRAPRPTAGFPSTALNFECTINEGFCRFSDFEGTVVDPDCVDGKCDLVTWHMELATPSGLTTAFARYHDMDPKIGIYSVAPPERSQSVNQFVFFVTSGPNGAVRNTAAFGATFNSTFNSTIPNTNPLAFDFGNPYTVTFNNATYPNQQLVNDVDGDPTTLTFTNPPGLSVSSDSFGTLSIKVLERPFHGLHVVPYTAIDNNGGSGSGSIIVNGIGTAPTIPTPNTAKCTFVTGVYGECFFAAGSDPDLDALTYLTIPSESWMSVSGNITIVSVNGIAPKDSSLRSFSLMVRDAVGESARLPETTVEFVSPLSTTTLQPQTYTEHNPNPASGNATQTWTLPTTTLNPLAVDQMVTLTVSVSDPSKFMIAFPGQPFTQGTATITIDAASAPTTVQVRPIENHHADTQLTFSVSHSAAETMTQTAAVTGVAADSPLVLIPGAALPQAFFKPNVGKVVNYDFSVRSFVLTQDEDLSITPTIEITDQSDVDQSSLFTVSLINTGSDNYRLSITPKPGAPSTTDYKLKINFANPAASLSASDIHTFEAPITVGSIGIQRQRELAETLTSSPRGMVFDLSTEKRTLSDFIKNPDGNVLSLTLAAPNDGSVTLHQTVGDPTDPSTIVFWFSGRVNQNTPVQLVLTARDPLTNALVDSTTLNSQIAASNSLELTPPVNSPVLEGDIVPFNISKLTTGASTARVECTLSGTAGSIINAQGSLVRSIAFNANVTDLPDHVNFKVTNPFDTSSQMLCSYIDGINPRDTATLDIVPVNRIDEIVITRNPDLLLVTYGQPTAFCLSGSGSSKLDMRFVDADSAITRYSIVDNTGQVTFVANLAAGDDCFTATTTIHGVHTVNATIHADNPNYVDPQTTLLVEIDNRNPRVKLDNIALPHLIGADPSTSRRVLSFADIGFDLDGQDTASGDPDIRDGQVDIATVRVDSAGSALINVTVDNTARTVTIETTGTLDNSDLGEHVTKLYVVDAGGLEAETRVTLEAQRSIDFALASSLAATEDAPLTLTPTTLATTAAATGTVTVEVPTGFTLSAATTSGVTGAGSNILTITGDTAALRAAFPLTLTPPANFFGNVALKYRMSDSANQATSTTETQVNFARTFDAVEVTAQTVRLGIGNTLDPTEIVAESVEADPDGAADSLACTFSTDTPGLLNANGTEIQTVSGNMTAGFHSIVAECDRTDASLPTAPSSPEVTLNIAVRVANIKPTIEATQPNVDIGAAINFIVTVADDDGLADIQSVIATDGTTNFAVTPLTAGQYQVTVPAAQNSILSKTNFGRVVVTDTSGSTATAALSATVSHSLEVSTPPTTGAFTYVELNDANDATAGFQSLSAILGDTFTIQTANTVTAEITFSSSDGSGLAANSGDVATNKLVLTGTATQVTAALNAAGIKPERYSNAAFDLTVKIDDGNPPATTYTPSTIRAVALDSPLVAKIGGGLPDAFETEVGRSLTYEFKVSDLLDDNYPTVPTPTARVELADGTDVSDRFNIAIVSQGGDAYQLNIAPQPGAPSNDEYVFKLVFDNPAASLSDTQIFETPLSVPHQPLLQNSLPSQLASIGVGHHFTTDPLNLGRFITNPDGLILSVHLEVAADSGITMSQQILAADLADPNNFELTLSGQVSKTTGFNIRVEGRDPLSGILRSTTTLTSSIAATDSLVLTAPTDNNPMLEGLVHQFNISTASSGSTNAKMDCTMLGGAATFVVDGSPAKTIGFNGNITGLPKSVDIMVDDPFDTSTQVLCVYTDGAGQRQEARHDVLTANRIDQLSLERGPKVLSVSYGVPEKVCLSDELGMRVTNPDGVTSFYSINDPSGQVNFDPDPSAGDDCFIATSSTHGTHNVNVTVHANDPDYVDLSTTLSVEIENRAPRSKLDNIVLPHLIGADPSTSRRVLSFADIGFDLDGQDAASGDPNIRNGQVDVATVRVDSAGSPLVRVIVDDVARTVTIETTGNLANADAGEHVTKLYIVDGGGLEAETRVTLEAQRSLQFDLPNSLAATEDTPLTITPTTLPTTAATSGTVTIAVPSGFALSAANTSGVTGTGSNILTITGDTATLQAAFPLTLTPKTNFFGNVAVKYRITDTSGQATNTAEMQVEFAKSFDALSRNNKAVPSISLNLEDSASPQPVLRPEGLVDDADAVGDAVIFNATATDPNDNIILYDANGKPYWNTQTGDVKTGTREVIYSVRRDLTQNPELPTAPDPTAVEASYQGQVILSGNKPVVTLESVTGTIGQDVTIPFTVTDADTTANTVNHDVQLSGITAEYPVFAINASQGRYEIRIPGNEVRVVNGAAQFGRLFVTDFSGQRSDALSVTANILDSDGLSFTTTAMQLTEVQTEDNTPISFGNITVSTTSLTSSLKFDIRCTQPNLVDAIYSTALFDPQISATFDSGAALYSFACSHGGTTTPGACLTAMQTHLTGLRWQQAIYAHGNARFALSFSDGKSDTLSTGNIDVSVSEVSSNLTRSSEADSLSTLSLSYNAEQAIRVNGWVVKHDATDSLNITAFAAQLHSDGSYTELSPFAVNAGNVAVTARANNPSNDMNGFCARFVSLAADGSAYTQPGKTQVVCQLVTLTDVSPILIETRAPASVLKGTWFEIVWIYSDPDGHCPTIDAQTLTQFTPPPWFVSSGNTSQTHRTNGDACELVFTAFGRAPFEESESTFATVARANNKGSTPSRVNLKVSSTVALPRSQAKVTLIEGAAINLGSDLQIEALNDNTIVSVTMTLNGGISNGELYWVDQEGVTTTFVQNTFEAIGPVNKINALLASLQFTNRPGYQVGGTIVTDFVVFNDQGQETGESLSFRHTVQIAARQNTIVFDQHNTTFALASGSSSSLVLPIAGVADDIYPDHPYTLTLTNMTLDENGVPVNTSLTASDFDAFVRLQRTSVFADNLGEQAPRDSLVLI